jgi:hypothetical protein
MTVGGQLAILVAFVVLGIAGAVWSRSWELSGRTAMVMVAVPYLAYYLAGCSP